MKTIKLKKISHFLKGFIDPFTLIGVAFLVVTLFVGTSVVSNKSFNLDWRKSASSSVACEGGVCNQTATKTGYTCAMEGECESSKPYCCRPNNVFTPAPTVVPTPNCANSGQPCSTRPCCDTTNYTCTDEGLSYPTCVKKSLVPTQVPRTPTPLPTPNCANSGQPCSTRPCCDTTNYTCTDEGLSYPTCVKKSLVPTQVPRTSTPVSTPVPTTRPSSTPSSCLGTCMYNSSCSVVNRKSSDGYCPPPAICCGEEIKDNCSLGNSYCVNSSTVAVCKTDRSGYIQTTCASPKVCDSTQKACITKSVSCNSEGSRWDINIPCCTGLVKATTPYGYFCSKQGGCTAGTNKCQLESTIYYQYKCDNNGYYQKETRCDSGCDGNICASEICLVGETRCGLDNSSVQVCKKFGGTTTPRADWDMLEKCQSGYSCDYSTKKCVFADIPEYLGITGDDSVFSGLYDMASQMGITSFLEWARSTNNQVVFDRNKKLAEWGISQTDFDSYLYALTAQLPFMVPVINTAVSMVPAIPGAISTLVSSSPQLLGTLNYLNLADDALTTAQCLAGDVNACSTLQATLLNPIPGAGLLDDINDVLNIGGISSLADNTANFRYDLLNPQSQDVDLFSQYEDIYGPLPNKLKIQKDPLEFYPFQKDAIDILKSGNADNPKAWGELLININDYAAKNNISISYESMVQLERKGFGTLGYVDNLNVAHVPKPQAVMDSYKINDDIELLKSEANILTMQKICHELGHVCDAQDLGLTGAKNNWSTEFRQKVFDLEFIENLEGTRIYDMYYDQYKDFVETVENSTKIKFR